MDNTVNSMLGMMSAAALQNSVNLAGDTAKTSSGDFQKLMEKAKSGQPDSQVEQPAKTEKPAAAEKKEAPAQNKEDSLTRLKKLAEQGYALTQPIVGCLRTDPETGEILDIYQAGEYVLAFNGENAEVVPITDLEPWQRLQLQQL